MNWTSKENLDIDSRSKLDEISSKDISLTNKERINLPAVEMPCQDPDTRINNFNEVALGLTENQAQLEAMRCLQCKNKPCIDGCPVKIDIPAFIKEIENKNYKKSIEIIKQSSLLPAICGRVCPQENQCQLHCTVGKSLKNIDLSVSIGRLERFVADWELENETSVPAVKSQTTKKVAIVGSGPASLVAAADIRREGHHVTIFEAFHKPGGVMVYGIPEFRLPKKIVQNQIDTLTKMGVEIKCDFAIGRTRKLNDLLHVDNFDAIFIGTGAGLPKFTGIEGENFIGVYSANEYLTRVNLMKAYNKEKVDTPIKNSKIVAVLGGGNVAMDAARTARRLGANKVYVIYRRTESEMPARKEEVLHAKEEEIEIVTLSNIKKIIGNIDQQVTSIECLKYELGTLDSSGRPSPVALKGSDFTINVDTVIIAVGSECNPIIYKTTKELNVDKSGRILIDNSCKTSINKVYAGGDIVLGAATVILAMGQGRLAAKAINETLLD